MVALGDVDLAADEFGELGGVVLDEFVEGVDGGLGFAEEAGGGGRKFFEGEFECAAGSEVGEAVAALQQRPSGSGRLLAGSFNKMADPEGGTSNLVSLCAFSFRFDRSHRSL